MIRMPGGMESPRRNSKVFVCRLIGRDLILPAGRFSPDEVGAAVERVRITFNKMAALAFRGQKTGVIENTWILTVLRLTLDWIYRTEPANESVSEKHNIRIVVMELDFRMYADSSRESIMRLAVRRINFRYAEWQNIFEEKTLILRYMALESALQRDLIAAGAGRMEP